MKKQIFTGLVATAGILLPLRGAYGAGVGAPSVAPGEFSVGFEQEYIFERKMDSTAYDAVLTKVGSDLVPGDLNKSGTAKHRITDLGRTMLNIGYRLSRNLEVHGKLGLTDHYAKFGSANRGVWAKNNTPPVPANSGSYHNLDDYEMRTAPVGALGFKLLFPVSGNRQIGVDAQYLCQKNKFDKTSSARVFDNAGAVIPGYSADSKVGSAGNGTVHEWHIAPFIAKNLRYGMYYAGFKYSDFIYKTGQHRYNASTNYGAFLGGEVRVDDMFTLGIEGRLLDETAATVFAAFYWGKPAAKPAPLAMQAPAPDTDSDGIADSLDACPGTPAGIVVDSRGCYPDADGDGVADGLDKCQGTAAGVKAGADGCVLVVAEQKALERLNELATPGSVTEGIVAGVKDAAGDPACPWNNQGKLCIKLAAEFEAGSDKPAGSFETQLQEIGSFMRANSWAMIALQGHTDSSGDKASNQQLSEKRAKAVEQYLVERGGLPAARVSSQGLGDSMPVQGNDTEEGRQRNRRVISILSLENTGN